MPTKTSRNAPCPCGSGKKYKKCCLAKDEAAEASVAVSEGAVARALGWLRDHYPDEFERAIALDYFDSLTPDQFEELDELPEDFREEVLYGAEDFKGVIPLLVSRER